MSKRLIDGDVNEITSLRHRAKGRGGRNKYSKGQRHYTRSVPKKMPKDTMPDDYIQAAGPENNSMGLAMQSAFFTSSAAGAVVENSTASLVGEVLSNSAEYSSTFEEELKKQNGETTVCGVEKSGISSGS